MYVIDWKIDNFDVLWNAVDPEPIVSGVFYPFNGLALRVRATIELESGEKRLAIDLHIVEPTRLNSKWSFNARFGSILSTIRHIDPLSEQFLQIYPFISLMRVLVALLLWQKM